MGRNRKSHVSLAALVFGAAAMFVPAAAGTIVTTEAELNTALGNSTISSIEFGTMEISLTKAPSTARAGTVSLTGMSGGTVLTGASASRVFTTNLNVGRIENLTFTHDDDAEPFAGMGGGVYVKGNVTDGIHNSKFINNTVTNASGANYGNASALYVGGSLTGGLHYVDFTGNHARALYTAHIKTNLIGDIDHVNVLNNTVDNQYATAVASGGPGITIGGKMTGNVVDSVFRGNHSFHEMGGALQLPNNNLEGSIIRTTFEDNSARDYGGGIDMWSTLTGSIQDSVFINNRTSTDSGNGMWGGGAFIYSGIGGDITGTRFESNVAGNGGGILVYGLVGGGISDSRFIANHASVGGGGAFFNRGMAGSITDTVFDSNTTAGPGGGLYINNQLHYIEGGTFTNNEASEGGAVAVAKLDVSIRASSNNPTVFSGNSATVLGGAIRATGATLHFIDPNLVNNSAGKIGGAIHTDSEIEMAISAGGKGILRGNTAGGAANDIYYNGSGSFAATVDANAFLDMHGGMDGAVNEGETVTIAKTGAGDWYLGGSSDFIVQNDTAAVNWSVSGGTLHLRGAGETVDGATTAENGSISLAGTNSSFVIGDDAATVLTVGGDNAITTGGELRLAAGTNIATTATGAASLKLDGRNGETVLDGPLTLATGASTSFRLDAALRSSGMVTRTGGGDLILARENVFANAPLTLRTGTMSSDAAQSFRQLVMASGTSAALKQVDIQSGSLRGSLTASSLTKSGSGTLAVYEPLAITGAMTMNSGKLDLYLNKTQAIISADEFIFNGGVLNIVGFNGQIGCEDEIPVITTNNVVQNVPVYPQFTIANVKDPQCQFLIVTLKRSSNGKDLVVGTKLNWYNSDPDKANGLFGIEDPDAEFTMGVQLTDNAAVNQSTNDKNWDGEVLIKGGPGTLTLTGDNSYSGGTIIQNGVLVAGRQNALGQSTGGIQFRPDLYPAMRAPELHLNYTGTLGNDITGQGDIEIAGDITYSGNRSGHNGVVAINEGSLTTTLGAGNQAFDDLRMDAGTALDVSGDITVSQGTIGGGVRGTGDFTKTTSGDLTIDGTVTVGGDFTLADGGLSLGLGDNPAVPVIDAGGAVDFGSAIVNITGHSGEPTGDKFLVARGGTGMTGPAGLAVNGQPSTTSSFLHVGMERTGNDLYVTTKLAWYNEDPNPDRPGYCSAHGNFDIAQDTFTLATVLTDFTSTTDDPFDWDGSVLIKTGAGTLVLTGDNSFSGGVFHNEGVLVARHENALGSGTVAVGAALRLEHDEVFDNVLSGDGPVAVRGEQTWTGDSPNYTGEVTIERGWIGLGERGGSGITHGGDFVVQNRTLLSGTGTIGGLSVEQGGRLEIGYSIGSLTVTGDATLAAGSNFIVEVDPRDTGSNDHLNVLGQATVADAIVTHSGLGGAAAYSPIGEWTILTAAGGVSGRFDPEVLKDGTNYALLRHTILYPDANNVVLRIERNERAFTDFAGTPNQAAVAAGLEALGGGSGLYNQIIANASETTLRPLLDQLSGEMHPSFRRMLQGYDRAFGTALLGRAGRTATEEDVMPVWVQVEGYSDRIGGDGNAARSTLRGVRSSIGVERRLLGGWLVGGAFQYGDTTFKTRERFSKADVDSFNFGLYAGREWVTGTGLMRLSFGGGYGFHDVDAERSVVSPVVADRLTSGYHAHTAQAFADFGLGFDAGISTLVEPFVRLGWNSVWTNGFTERGGLATLSSRDEHQGNLTHTLGVRASRQVNATASLHASAGWVHTYGSRDVTNSFTFVDGGAGLVVGGVRTPANMAAVSAGASFAVNARTQVHLGYDGLFGSRTQNHAGNIALQVSF